MSYCGFERTKKRKNFLFKVENRNCDTIKSVFRTFILPRSIIHTDIWPVYVNVCEKLGFEHKIVQHKYHFKDPETGFHTNTIEGSNGGIKSL